MFINLDFLMIIIKKYMIFKFQNIFSREIQIYKLEFLDKLDFLKQLYNN